MHKDEKIKRIYEMINLVKKNKPHPEDPLIKLVYENAQCHNDALRFILELLVEMKNDTNN